MRFRSSLAKVCSYVPSEVTSDMGKGWRSALWANAWVETRRRSPRRTVVPGRPKSFLATCKIQGQGYRVQD